MPMFHSPPRSRLHRRPGKLCARFRMAGLLPGLCLIWSVSQAAVPGYGDFDAVLLRNVERGFVDYAGIAADPAFARFMVSLEETRPEEAADSRARSALLINAYNAFAIQGILDGYSPSSRLGRYSYFRRLEYQLMGEPVTLHDLETRQLMPLGDPRIHFAIVCASISCPRLCQPRLCAGKTRRTTGRCGTCLHQRQHPQPLRRSAEDRVRVEDIRLVRCGLRWNFRLCAAVHRSLRQRPGSGRTARR